VLDEADLAAGDFVRWTKQTIDLLDQLSMVADGRRHDRAPRSTPSVAASSLRLAVSGSPRLDPCALPAAVARAARGAGGLVLTTAFPALSWWRPCSSPCPRALIAHRPAPWPPCSSAPLRGGLFFVNLSFTARYLGPCRGSRCRRSKRLTAVMAIPIAWVSVDAAHRPARGRASWRSRARGGALGRARGAPRHVPYGGFLGALGVTQASSPLADVASWTGMSGCRS
jgi:apolipoprotein N-acyltransferase